MQQRKKAVQPDARDPGWLTPQACAMLMCHNSTQLESSTRLEHASVGEIRRNDVIPFDKS